MAERKKDEQLGVAQEDSGRRGGGEEMVTATGYLLEEVIGLTAEGTKGADYKGDYSHTVTGGGVPDWPK